MKLPVFFSVRNVRGNNIIVAKTFVTKFLNNNTEVLKEIVTSPNIKKKFRLDPAKQNKIKSSVNMTQYSYKKMYSPHQEEEKAAKKEGSLFVNPMPTPYSVKKAKEQNTWHIKQDEFNIRTEFLQKNKQGENKDSFAL